jgi:hypothetical protein
MCNRWAIFRIVKAVSRLNLAAIATFSGCVFGISARSVSFHFSRFNSAAIISSPLAFDR